jgi:hypothetical protein
MPVGIGKNMRKTAADKNLMAGAGYYIIADPAHNDPVFFRQGIMLAHGVNFQKKMHYALDYQD